MTSGGPDFLTLPEKTLAGQSPAATPGISLIRAFSLQWDGHIINGCETLEASMPITNLLGLTRLAKPLTSEEGRRILERDQYRCQYCGLDGMSNFENSLIMTVDFVQPRAHKGKKMPANLVTACRPCNVIKGLRSFPSLAEDK